MANDLTLWKCKGTAMYMIVVPDMQIPSPDNIHADYHGFGLGVWNAIYFKAHEMVWTERD